MMVKWSFFAGAAILAAYFLIRGGVPVIPVLAGCAVAALMTWRKIAHPAQERH